MRFLSSIKRYRYLIAGIGFGTVLTFLAVILSLSHWSKNGVVSESYIDDPIFPKASDTFAISEVSDRTTAQLDIEKNNFWGEVWEICGVAKFPTSSKEALQFIAELKLTEECKLALHDRVLSLNPFTQYKWLNNGTTGDEFYLIVLDNPMTLERVFSDPERDLAKVVDALTNPACQLNDAWAVDWNLKDSCNAEAFTNYAVFYRICYQDFTTMDSLRHPRAFDLVPEGSELINLMWVDYLEHHWIKEKCGNYDSLMKLNTENYPIQFDLLQTLRDQQLSYEERQIEENLRALFNSDRNTEEIVEKTRLYGALLSLGARFGDEAATLTHLGWRPEIRYHQRWRSEWQTIRFSRIPTEERVQQALDLVKTFEENDVKFEWDWLVNHICSPGQLRQKSEEEPTTALSCRTVIESLYTKFAFAKDSRLEILEEFERVALDLDVYD